MNIVSSDIVYLVAISVTYAEQKGTQQNVREKNRTSKK